MRIEIDPRVANDPDAHRWLDRILHRIEDGWHVWDTTDLSEVEKITDTTWIRDRDDQGRWVRSLLDASIQRGAWTLAPHGRSVRVTVAPIAPDEFRPEEAFRLVDEPLYILVENRNSDGAFVKRVVSELDRSLLDLWNRLGEPIRFDSVGGKGEMPKEVALRAGKTCYRPRLVVVIDSDRKAPGAHPSKQARLLHRACSTHNVPCWILAKREAENYLPRILLSARRDVGADHAVLVDAWDRLTDDQKNFIDMKRGLQDIHSEVEQELFAGLSPSDREALAGGFGGNVYKCWCIRNVWARKDLILRSQGDLEHGIRLIRQEV